MPRLTTQQVAPQPRPLVQETGAMQPGAGVIAGVGQAAEIFAREAEQARQRGLAIRRNELEVQARRAANVVLYDPKTGILNRQRQAAFDAPEAALGEWRKAADALLVDVRDPELRAEAMALVSRIGANVEEQAIRHARQQMDVADAENTKALQETLVGDIVANAVDDRATTDAIGRLEQVTRDRLARQDVTDKAVVDAELARVRSQARLAQITTLAERNPSVARETLTRYEDELRWQDKLDAQRLVRAESLAVESQTARDTLVAEFGDDESAALEAVSDRYKGEMEDVVRQRVEVHYAGQRRLNAQVTNKLFNDLAVVAQTTGDLAARQADVERLRERDPAKAKRLEAYARQTRTGEAAETNWDVWGNLTGLNVEQLREINPLEYRSELADREYNALNRMVQRANGTGEFAREQAGMTEAQFTNTAFEEAQRLDLLPRSVASWRSLKGENGVRFTQLMDGVQAEMDRMMGAQNGRPLSRQQQREAIANVYDDLVMERVGVFGRREVPRAMVTDPTRVRELTPTERADVDAGRIPRPISGETREQYWNRLVQRGIAPDSATAFAMREIIQ